MSGLSGTITDLNVQINGLNHTFPDDIDMLLVAPGGQNAIFMSDAGGGTDVVNCNLTLDDEAATALPDNTALTCPGSYQPANYEPGDPFPAPAPAPSGNVNLSTFDGGTPNGTWSLYVVDDLAQDTGTITSWSLSITTSGGPPPPPPPPPPSCQSTKILIAYSDTGGQPTMLRNALLAEPGVTAVDLFDAFNGTPTLNQLRQYKIVLAFSNS
ncbi:MAG: hypothetical protein E6G31_11125, partial [Actinobacteria bacterium]